MPPPTMSSTSNVILFPGRRFGPSDRKPRRIGAARLLRHDRQLGVHQLPSEGLKLTKPPLMLSGTAKTHEVFPEGINLKREDSAPGQCERGGSPGFLRRPGSGSDVEAPFVIPPGVTENEVLTFVGFPSSQDGVRVIGDEVGAGVVNLI